MGFLLKIILFGVAIYAVWKTLARWKGLYDRFVGNPQEPARPAPPPNPPPAAPRGRRPGQRPQGRNRGDGPMRWLRGLYLGHCGKMRPVRPPPGITTPAD